MGEGVVPARVDGRTRRAERTRRAIVDAHLALLDEGELKPTGERIAERAGVSLRALWTNFKDMETLFAAVGGRLLDRHRSVVVPISPDLPIERRIELFCRQRAEILEAIAPAARAARLREPFSAQLRENRTVYLATMRDEVEAAFAVELAAAGSARTVLLHALSVATAWSTWSMLRDDLGLDPPAARTTMAHTVTALVSQPQISLSWA